MESVVSKPVDPVGLASDIVSAFVSHNSLPATELAALIQSVHEALTRLSSGAISSTTTTVGPEATTPAVSIRKSITPEFLICLDDGRKFKSLKRHLAGLGMTPDQYRSKWQLPHDLSDGGPQLRIVSIGVGEEVRAWSTPRRRQCCQDRKRQQGQAWPSSSAA
jgi:predicted transcriptional regulator